MGWSLGALWQPSVPAMLGVDIGASSVKLVELGGGRRDAPTLLRYAIEPLASGVVDEAGIQQPDALVLALQRALRRSEATAEPVALALPAAAVITRRIVLPAGLDEEDYEVQVEAEANQYVPFPIDEVDLDFMVLGPAERAGEIDVLIAASRRDKVQERLQIALRAGLKPVVMDVVPFAARAALARVARRGPGAASGQILALIDLAQAITAVSFVLDGQTVFERQQDFGGATLTTRIAQRYGLTLEEAAQRQRTQELPDGWREALLAPFVGEAVVEIGRALQFFMTSTAYSRVDKVYLAGGGATLPGMVEALAQGLGQDVEPFSPFDGMTIAPQVSRAALSRDACVLGVACGLALRRFDSERAL